jgi:adenosylcobinamide-phosphate synthase
MMGALATALALDWAVGDPDGAWHPVRMMGAFLARGEAWARRDPRRLRARGVVLALANVGLAWGVGFCLLRCVAWVDGFYGLQGWAIFAAQALMVWSCIGVRSMLDHAVAVLAALELGDLTLARLAVARIVGRDTAGLDAAGVRRACLESVAESLGDGVVAPLFFGMLGGGPLALAYRAANTADSLIGHKDAAYAQLGWAAARLDDLLNWIPARKAALCATCAAYAMRLSASGALRCARQDGPKQPSPNSGWPEGAFAGALGVQLGGALSYRGQTVEKPTLGQARRPLDDAVLRQGLTLFLVASLVSVIVLELILWLRSR